LRRPGVVRADTHCLRVRVRAGHQRTKGARLSCERPRGVTWGGWGRSRLSARGRLPELDLEFLDLVDLDALHAGQRRADLLERGVVAELLHLLEAGRVGQQLAEGDVEHRDFL